MHCCFNGNLLCIGGKKDKRTHKLNTYYLTPILIQKCILMVPVPSNKIPQIHNAGVHIMQSLFPPEQPQTCLTAPY